MKTRHAKPPTLVPEQELADMLHAFAGPAEPLRTRARGRAHQASRRTVVVAAVVLAALAIAVPATALREQLHETVAHFVGDTSQPLNARKVIESFIRQRHAFEPRLTEVRRVVTVETPAGEYGLYELRFANGEEGATLISTAADGVAGATWGPPFRCPAGSAISPRGSVVEHPGQTPLFVWGTASQDVASVDVVYPDGHAVPDSAAGNGYFLAWVIPLAGAPGTRAGVSPPVTLVARDSEGKELGRLALRSDGDVPPLPGQPEQGPACSQLRQAPR
jgi:hypothetical protein